MDLRKSARGVSVDSETFRTGCVPSSREGGACLVAAGDEEEEEEEEEEAEADAENAEVAARRRARTLLDSLSRTAGGAGGCSTESTMELDRPGDARKKRRAAMAVVSPPASGSGSASSRYSASSSSRKAGDDVDAEDVGGEADVVVDGADADPSSYDSDGCRRATWKHPSIARSAPLIGIPLVGKRDRGERGARETGTELEGDW
jgi:hypothetical protein